MRSNNPELLDVFFAKNVNLGYDPMPIPQREAGIFNVFASVVNTFDAMPVGIKVIHVVDHELLESLDHGERLNDINYLLFGDRIAVALVDSLSLIFSAPVAKKNSSSSPSKRRPIFTSSNHGLAAATASELVCSCLPRER